MNISHEPKLMHEDEFKVYEDLKDAVVFLNSAHDSGAKCIPDDWIAAMLRWIGRQDPSNKFLLQSKNPERWFGWFKDMAGISHMLRIGTTIESNRAGGLSAAPAPEDRAWALATVRETMEKIGRPVETFLSIEPVMTFDVEPMVRYVRAINPVCIEVGVDHYPGRHPGTVHPPSLKKYREFKRQVTKMGWMILEKDDMEAVLR
jgi:hypothetical protein